MASDQVLVSRSIARAALVSILSDISEEEFAAGWMQGTEDGVFARLVGNERGRNWAWADCHAGTLISLARVLNEWPGPGDDNDWVPLSEMERRWGSLPNGEAA